MMKNTLKFLTFGCYLKKELKKKIIFRMTDRPNFSEFHLRATQHLQNVKKEKKILIMVGKIKGHWW